MKHSTHILLIDDDPISNLVTTKMFHHVNTNLQVTEFHFAPKAVRYLEELSRVSLNNTEWLPQCILLDLYMPLMNGWEFLNYLQHSEFAHLRTIPVFITSAAVQDFELKQAANYANIVGFIPKPLRKEIISDLLEMINMSIFPTQSPQLLFQKAS